MRKKLFLTGLRWLWLAIIVIAVDRYTKYWMLQYLKLSEPLPVASILNFTLAYNTGAAFSFLHAASGWQNKVLAGVASLVSWFIIRWLAKLPAEAWWNNIALCLILGGALGNIWDRLLYGYVIDFIDFHWQDWHFAIFNLADSAICLGAAMLFLTWLCPARAKK